MFGMILKYHSWEPEVQVIHKCDFVVYYYYVAYIHRGS